MATGPHLLVLSGLVWTAVRCIRLLSGRRPRALVLAPHTLIALGFWLSQSTDTIWIMIAVGGVFALTLYALRCLREPSGAVLASVLATSVLVELGSLLVVRLVIVRDPAAPFGSGLTREAWLDAGPALLLPLALVGVALVLGHRFGGSVARRSRPWRRRRSVLLVFGFAALGLFALPLVEGSQLTFLGVATPEFGTIAFLVVLALLVARVGYRQSVSAAPRRGGPRPRLAARVRLLRLRYRHVVYPLGLFAIVAVISAARDDFGTVVPALAATVGVTWAAARQVVADPDETRRGVARLARTLRGYRATGLSILAMLVIAGILAFGYTDYLSERARTWVDPWRYRWDGGCVVPPGVPPGSGLCQESLVANVESANSQVSRALAAIADGGLWGRGLADPMSAAIPAGESDFVLAVMWNKLGGLAVLLAALLIALLAVALRQATRTGRADAVPTASGLFASGLAAMIVGQFLFVFAATLNVVPHSGIPAPFLSRGGQATLALLLGIMIVVAVAPSSVPSPRSRPASPPAAPTSPPAALASPAAVATVRPVLVGVAAPVGLCLLLAAGITFAPYQSLHQIYAEDRPLCAPREATRASLSSPPPDPARCSTDQIAYRRTRIELRLPGGLRLQQQRPAGDWVLVGSGALTLADLTGLVRIGAGGPGALDTAYASVVTATAPTTLAKRVAPPLNLFSSISSYSSVSSSSSSSSSSSDPSEVHGWVDLTIDPALQHALAGALSSDVDGPVAGGVVAMDAGSGEILAAASAPSWSLPTPAPVLGPNGDYGRLDAAGGIRPDPTCTRDAAADGDPGAAGCWRWSGVGAVAPDHDLGSPSVNRALDRPYRLGSLVQVLIASAYLNSGGHAEDLVPGAGCRGTIGGRITVTAALAVACAATFDALAARMGWAAIAEQARRLGFPAGVCPSCLTPSTAVGGELHGTPLTMAAMMATIANGGQARTPTFARFLRYPDSGRTETPRPSFTSVLPAPVATGLRQALSRTAADGAAAGLQAHLGAPLWMSIGLAPTSDAGLHAWTAGFLRTPHGDVAFAAVVETRDGPAGLARLRHLVETVARSVGVVASWGER